MLAAMKRTAPIEDFRDEDEDEVGNGSEGACDPVTLDSYGYTMQGVQVWWNPETHETYTYRSTADHPDGCFCPHTGPVIFGTGYTF